MAEIIYLDGDATYPQVQDNNTVVYIPHICNDLGQWGAGFTGAISARWKNPERAYRRWHKNQLEAGNSDFKLGESQYVRVQEGLGYCSPTIYVVNMIAQHGKKGLNNNWFPIRYGATERCLQNLYNTIQIMKKWTMETNHEVHMPRIGTGLACGSWKIITEQINANLVNRGVAVYVYNFNKEK